MLASRGHYVIRFDNRDTGLSTHFDDAPVPNMAELMQARTEGKPMSASYLLDDMAADAAGLLDVLGIRAAHIVGASMGGMIAQAFAIRYPDRTLSLTSIMSTTGNPELPQAKPEAMAMLTTPVPTEREANMAHRVKSARVIGSPAHFDEARIRDMAGRAFDRAFYPVGVARQMAAVWASGSRKEALASVKTATLVIHGEVDPLVPVEGGKDTAASVPGAKLLIIEGMGHDMPPALWPRIVDAISEHTATVGRAAARA
jgi:pimeloyl-ACP methyl ester carboxylesterase